MAGDGNGRRTLSKVYINTQGRKNYEYAAAFTILWRNDLGKKHEV